MAEAIIACASTARFIIDHDVGPVLKDAHNMMADMEKDVPDHDVRKVSRNRARPDCKVLNEGGEEESLKFFLYIS